jgi:opacity protein-like surface antigen
MKKLIIIIMLILPCALSAGDKFSAGLTAGYQHDVGMLSDRRGVQADVQQNIAAGLMLKLDMSKIFIRTGVDYSYPFAKGRIRDGSGGDITGTEISFYEVPVYAGINLLIRDFGNFYMGGGGSYIFGTGRVKKVSGDSEINEQLFGWGLIAGLESDIFNNASFIFEWEYMAARSSPVASTGAGSYDDFYIDYSGHRIRFGVIYHFSRY